MRIFVIIILIALLLSGQAKAQSWGEQQKTYSNKANLEAELFQQREEMERMRQENERAVEKQRREMELQQIYTERERKEQEQRNWRTNGGSVEWDAEKKQFVVSP